MVRKYLSVVLSVLLLLVGIVTEAPQIYASEKKDESRAIAIVFDNSGSMYEQNNQAWCRATYAMEVFASMLNKGDVLQIYPMWPIEVGGNTYSMEDPFVITDSAQASTIRDIFTENASGTPIESIDCAAEGLQKVNAAKKYMIVLTDGGTFSKNYAGLSKDRTRRELDKRIEEYAGESMSVMYLGIGSDACMPDSKESEYFVKAHAVNTEDVLSTLTVMCNQIFGRDSLPKNRISGNTMEFDISMSKLIVFVQGEKISDLKIAGASSDQLVSSQQTKYSTKGAGDYKSVPDKSLQGMMVTYTDFAAGSYEIEYSGTASSVEVYYEPDADLDFVFTSANGSTVNPNALYEGEYKVSFGMKDAQTGELISSDLLGNPKYEGSYFINGEEHKITHEGYSGEESVTLNMDDTFDAKLTVTYLSGYTISKDTSDFGWPEGGIKVAPRPAGELTLEITGGDEVYSLQDLDEGSPFTAKVFYEGTQLTGKELESVELKWDPDTSNAEIKQNFADDHYDLTVHYKDPDAPQDTVCGECTVTIHAFYSAKGSNEAEAQCPMTYNINDDFSPLQMELSVPESYIVISELADSRPIKVDFTLNGAKLTPEDFASVQLQVDAGGVNYEISPNEQDASFDIKLLETAGIAEGDYKIDVKAIYTDHIGRATEVDESVTITLSSIPLWMRWAIGILLFLIIFAIIWAIMHIRVLPKYTHTTKKLSTMVFDGDNVTQSTNFAADLKKNQLKIQSKYGGKNVGIAMDVTPGKESYLYKSQKRRSALVKVPSVRKFGVAKIQEAMIGSAKYVADEDTGKLVPALANQKPFVLTNGMMVKYSGTIQDAGVDKDFEVTSKLNFRKK